MDHRCAAGAGMAVVVGALVHKDSLGSVCRAARGAGIRRIVGTAGEFGVNGAPFGPLGATGVTGLTARRCAHRGQR
ncbi:hypothetical protein MAUB_39980 [Mycolicibacterium aubagnense]|uniref:Uncharacterized protein n=1 Tax=Mycolicibacterium aubagnense TaxID=319707 RepID=A0ABN5YW59_9MYCO|nr:hypothetical protein MAUB_39980 [Mycolicibacterium aubagnense]